MTHESPFTGGSVYSHLKLCAENYSKQPAISFYGNTISYEKLFFKINETARALTAYGIKKGDIVAASLPGIPEGIYLIYAINKIGAIYCAFDCRAKNQEIKETLRTFAPKLCIVPNFQLREFHDIQDCNVVYINPIHALGNAERFTSLFTDFFTGRDFVRLKNPKVMTYDRFLRLADQIPEVADADVSYNDIFGYFYTSGTTLGRKSVILTNRNLNASVTIQRLSNPMIQSGLHLLNIMPLFTCYSITHAVHLPLISGICIHLIPLVKPKKLKQLLLAEKPNFIITVPAHWEYFIREDFTDCDLSFMKNIVIGGDTIHPAFRKKLNHIFETYGGCAPVMVGYGLTETTSCAVAAFDAPEGSVGHAHPYMQIAIFDPETGSALPAGQKGEICIHGPTVCSGYYQDQEATDKLLRKHNDGKIWLHSGDKGYIDETGALYFCERYKRMYVRFDGTKISPYSIEQVIAGCPVVESCLVVAIADEAHSHGKCAKAYIVPKKGANRHIVLTTVRQYCKKHLYEHMRPQQFVITDSLPRAKSGKLRYFE